VGIAVWRGGSSGLTAVVTLPQIVKLVGGTHQFGRRNKPQGSCVAGLNGSLNGNVTATFFQNPSPPFGQHISCSGRYRVAADCTASVTFNAGSCTNGDPFQMTIVDNGARIFMLAAQSTQLPLVFLLDRIH
jgi:hypothetical protein